MYVRIVLSVALFMYAYEVGFCYLVSSIPLSNECPAFYKALFFFFMEDYRSHIKTWCLDLAVPRGRIWGLWN
jgi:hypothetical protein